MRERKNPCDDGVGGEVSNAAADPERHPLRRRDAAGGERGGESLVPFPPVQHCAGGRPEARDSVSDAQQRSRWAAAAPDAATTPRKRLRCSTRGASAP